MYVYVYLEREEWIVDRTDWVYFCRSRAHDIPNHGTLHTTAILPPPPKKQPTQVEPHVPIDQRVDVWAMGCLLFAAAYGRSPFESPTEGVLKLGILRWGLCSFAFVGDQGEENIYACGVDVAYRG